MDGARFDSLAKALGGATSRRGVLKALFGAAGIGVIGGLTGGGESAAASCRRGGDICSKNGDCCSSICNEKDRTGRRRCACETGQTACNNNCCAVGDICLNGSCITPTPVPTPTLTPVPANGTCFAGSDYVGNGVACGTTGAEVCAKTESSPDGECCGVDGIECLANVDCCGICNQPAGGVCQPSASNPNASCRSDGQACVDGVTCCSGNCCSGVCTSTSCGNDGTCGIDGRYCESSDDECCGALGCDTKLNRCRACTLNGGDCLSNVDCCGICDLLSTGKCISAA